MLVCKAKDGEANEQITKPVSARMAATTRGAAVSAKKKKKAHLNFSFSEQLDYSTVCVHTGDVSCPHLAGSITVQIPPRACRCSQRRDSVPDENGANVPLTWPLPSAPPCSLALALGVSVLARDATE